MKSTDALNLLEKWKPLPNYRAEPRVDFLISLAIPEIIRQREKVTDEIQVIIPEFPLRIGSLKNHPDIDKSYKVDFYVLLKSGKNIFIEVKTDKESRREKQDNYLKIARETQMQNLLKGIIRIYKVTDLKYKSKYQYLLDILQKNGLIKELNDDEYIPTSKRQDIEILYIQPQGDEENIINFKKLSDIFCNTGDPFLERFGEILKKWQ